MKRRVQQETWKPGYTVAMGTGQAYEKCVDARYVHLSVSLFTELNRNWFVKTLQNMQNCHTQEGNQRPFLRI